MEHIIKYILALFLGILAVLEPTLKFAVILFFAIIFDCLSAYDLNRRLKKQHPSKVSGKFESRYALRMFKTFVQAYAVIILVHWVDVVILLNFNYLNLSNIAAALFCAIQLWSILENLSSGNGANWAKKLQTIMVDKAARHFNIKLNNNEKTNSTNAKPASTGGLQNDQVAGAEQDRAQRANVGQREPPTD